MEGPVQTPAEQERLAHALALQLLTHTRDYLARLPKVPATQEMMGRIDAFLTDPQAAVAAQQARESLI